MKFKMGETLKAYRKKGTNVSATCKAVGISRTEFYRQKEKSKRFATGLKDIEESILDNAESLIVKKMSEGDIRALIFYLESKGRKRGYGRKLELEGGNVENPVKIILPDNGREFVKHEPKPKQKKKPKVKKKIKKAKKV